MPKRDRAANQLQEFKESVQKPDRLTTAAGIPIGSKSDSLTVGPRGPVLLQDVVLIDEMAHFTRERIPERVVHAKGSGASGYFEVTHDVSKYTKANVFNTIGKRTPLAVRFSTVSAERGSADTVRDPRGFAVKLYTEEGNLDIVGNNIPTFFIRDPLLFPAFVHILKRNPVTNLRDPDMFWDMMSLRPETTHNVMFNYSDRGTPDGYRHMNGYSSHTYKLVNKENKAVYCKFHWKTDQGIKNIPADKALALTATEPDYSQRDLYNAIAEGNFPSWTLKIQVMSFEEAERFRWNPFDLTKIWPQSEYPLIPVGRMVLNRNPKNYFAEVEQIAMSPTNLVPGVEPSPDKMLQARLFAYDDTHRHRLGANYHQIPINCPFNSKARNYHRDGPQTVNDNQGGAPVYFPNSFSGPVENPVFQQSTFTASGEVQRYSTAVDDDFTQPRNFWNKVLKPDERVRLIDNLSAHLKDAQEFIQQRMVDNFSKVEPQIGRLLQDALNKYQEPEAAARSSL